MEITRQQFLAEIEKRWHGVPDPAKYENDTSLSGKGLRHRSRIARSLYYALKRGHEPTARETAGYFGKSARFRK